MSAFTGTDLKSTNLPAAILELTQKAQVAEQALTPAKNNVSLSINADGTSASISVNLPVSMLPNATSGNIEITATDYIV